VRAVKEINTKNSLHAISRCFVKHVSW